MLNNIINKVGFVIGYSGAILSALNILVFKKNEPLYWVVIGMTILGLVMVCYSWVERKNKNEKNKV